MQNKSLADRIIKASIVVGIAHLLLKFSGLIQAKCCAQFLDDAQYTAIIAIGLGAILNSLFLIGEECIGPTFLTLFVREKEQKNEAAAWHFTNVTLSFQSLVLLVVVAAMMCFPDFFIQLVTQLRQPVVPADGASPDEMMAYTTALQKYNSVYLPLRTSLQVIAPALLFLSLGSTTYVLLNGYKKFFFAAFGDASTKICIIVGLVIGWYFKFGIRALYLGILLGSVAKLLTHLLAMPDKLRNLRLSFDYKNRAFRDMLWLMVPLLVGILFAKFRDIFNNVYVLTGENIPNCESVIKANDLGRKLFTTIQWLIPYALQIALFPFLCDLVNQNDRTKLGEVIGSSCRMLLALFMPLAAMLAVIGVPLTVLIFLGGETSPDVAAMAGVSTMCYCLVLPAAAVECVLMQGAFADRKTVAVTVIGVLSSMVSVLLSAYFILYRGVSAQGALLVVALGFVASRFMKSIVLILHLRRSTPMFEARETMVFLGKTIGVTVLVACVGWLASRGVGAILPDGLDEAFGGQGALADIRRSRLMVRIAVSGMAGLGTFVLAAKLLKLREPAQMGYWALEKLHRKKRA